jgi:hypothetical protein
LSSCMKTSDKAGVSSWPSGCHTIIGIPFHQERCDWCLR